MKALCCRLRFYLLSVLVWVCAVSLCLSRSQCICVGFLFAKCEHQYNVQIKITTELQIARLRPTYTFQWWSSIQWCENIIAYIYIPYSTHDIYNIRAIHTRARSATARQVNVRASATSSYHIYTNILYVRGFPFCTTHTHTHMRTSYNPRARVQSSLINPEFHRNTNWRNKQKQKQTTHKSATRIYCIRSGAAVEQFS